MECQRVEFGSGFSIPGLDPRDKTRGPDPARLGYRVFSQGPDLPQSGPTGPVWGLGPIHGLTTKKKKKFKPKFIFSYVQAQIYFCCSSLHIPNKKIKPKFIFVYIQTCIFKFKPR